MSWCRLAQARGNARAQVLGRVHFCAGEWLVVDGIPMSEGYSAWVSQRK